MNLLDFKPKDVENFISQFRTYDESGDVRLTFLNGMCYWFAYIIAGRFPGMELVYEPVDCHWLATADGHYYDIRGDVTRLYSDGRQFYSEEYALEINSIVEGTILKIN